jgi:hypothetical protein
MIQEQFVILAPRDFFLFRRLKSTLKGKQFQDVLEIKLNTTRQLQAIRKQGYQTCTEKWKDRWNRCIQLEGRSLKEITSSNL